jgi:cellulose synthase/poly-beta-1,6-N-acetylglucosamine synthase-like glycosyltransferase
MSSNPHHASLWGSYEKSVDHAFGFHQNLDNPTNGYISRTSTLAPLIISLLFVSGLCLAATLVLIRSHTLLSHNERESGYSLYQHLSFLLVFYSINYAGAVLGLAFKNLVYRRLNQLAELGFLLAINLGLLSLSLIYSPQSLLFIASFLTCFLLMVFGKILFRHYSFAGINFYIASCLCVLIGIAWAADFFVLMPAGHTTKILLLCTVPFLLIKLPSGFLGLLELYDVICRDHWRRPRHSLPENRGAPQPFVSLQVPTYSEPPEIVIETLNRLAQLDYTNYEVIVIDNNTKDPALWQPVQTHCHKLGHRFKFLHIEGLKGAKAGALNYISKYCDPRTTVMGVIDADYQADKGFLKALVGYFADPKIGFVQTPHDYREWKDNLFLTMCYWEYRLFFHSVMISLNERDAGITVGTMCLIRKEALERAGGWSEWCVTEDSELAIRIHDLGYSSVYIDKTYGRGLIPDSFEGYKKQRYRWTAGPVQEFRHYFKHFIGLPKRESSFSFLQRTFHLNHGLSGAILAFNIPLLLIGVATITSMIIHKEVIAAPFELWVAATITLVASPVLTFLLYRVTVRATVKDIIGQTIAAKALSHVIYHAAFRTIITGNAAWKRTNKFKSIQSYLSALISTKEEFVIGLSLLVFIMTAYLIFPHQGLTLMLLIGVFYVSLNYFAAPLMAVIGVWSSKPRHEIHHNPAGHVQF